MEMKFMSLFLLISLIVNVTEQSELISSHQPIVALVGDGVILPCHLEPPINVRSQTVVWTKPGLNPESVHYHQDGRLIFENQNPSYHSRTRLFMDELEKGNVSMKIFKVKLSDSGEYKCFLPSMMKEASIQLTVGESDVIGSDEPVKATVGQDVVLPCHIEPPFDVSTLTVEWKQGEKQVHLYRSGTDVIDGQDESYKDRTSLFHEEMIRGNISLKLTKVTKEDTGSYTCYVPRLESQVKRGNVTLNVVRGKEEIIQQKPTDGPGLSTGAVIGIIIGILVVGIVGLLVWKRRRKPEENAGDGRRGQQDQMDGHQEAIALYD